MRGRRKGSLLLVVALVTTAAAAPAPAGAQLGRKSWEFYPHVGPFFPADPGFLEGLEPSATHDREFEGFDPGVLWGIYATYHYSDYVGVELGFSKATANGPEGDLFFVLPGEPSIDVEVGDVGFDLWELNGFLNSGALNRFQTFATGGLGLVNFDPERGDGVTRLLVNGGVGVRYYAWRNVALRGEVKDFVFPGARRPDYSRAVRICVPEGCPGPPPPRGPDDTIHNIGILAGITFNF